MPRQQRPVDDLPPPGQAPQQPSTPAPQQGGGTLQQLLPLIAFAAATVGGGRAGGAGFGQGFQQAQQQQLQNQQAQQQQQAQQERLRLSIEQLGLNRERQQQQQETAQRRAKRDHLKDAQTRIDKAATPEDAERIIISSVKRGLRLGLTEQEIRDAVVVPEGKFDEKDIARALEMIQALPKGTPPESVLPSGETVADLHARAGLPIPVDGGDALTYGMLNGAAKGTPLENLPVPTDRDGVPDVAKAATAMRGFGLLTTDSERTALKNVAIDQWRQSAQRESLAGRGISPSRRKEGTRLGLNVENEVSKARMLASEQVDDAAKTLTQSGFIPRKNEFDIEGNIAPGDFRKAARDLAANPLAEIIEESEIRAVVVSELTGFPDAPDNALVGMERTIERRIKEFIRELQEDSPNGVVVIRTSEQ